jgi:hypothetical protein
MNKKQQKQASDYGAHYPFNIASEQVVGVGLLTGSGVDRWWCVISVVVLKG